MKSSSLERYNPVSVAVTSVCCVHSRVGVGNKQHLTTGENRQKCGQTKQVSDSDNQRVGYLQAVLQVMMVFCMQIPCGSMAGFRS